VAWTIEYARSARKAVEKLDPQTRGRLRRFLEVRVAELEDPRSIGKALTGPLASFWSYRLGDHRVLCEIQDRRVVILVVTIGNRRDVYR
jgi:mRNA interferase RelE/StbE